ncbi:MAG: hypothetical protein ACYC6Y_25850 [Thermoguttaceae bacterium]
MTIAACYVSSEGVVFGADSTSTMFVVAPGPNPSGAEHHYNYAQKIFQVGQDSTLGISMWGLGNIAQTSYRTLIAQFDDTLVGQGATTMAEVAERWSQHFWTAYSSAYTSVLVRAQQLELQPTKTPDEEDELGWLLQAFSGGFCIGGYLLNDRTPSAYEITYGPTQTAPTPPTALKIGSTMFWGCPNLINRLVYGVDVGVLNAVLNSGKWTGTDQELIALATPHCLGQPRDLPIREAIDWVHASIYTTNKTMKFSHMAPVCGGPVEIAVITTDRKFRWVRHKRFDAALNQGGLEE